MKDEKSKPRVVWCVCGRQKHIRARDEMTPTTSDVQFGIVAYVIFLALGVVLGVPLFSLLVMGATLVLMALLTLIRLAQHHSFYCAARWSYVAFFSIGRNLSF